MIYFNYFKLSRDTRNSPSFTTNGRTATHFESKGAHIAPNIVLLLHLSPSLSPLFFNIVVVKNCCELLTLGAPILSQMVYQKTRNYSQKKYFFHSRYEYIKQTIVYINAQSVLIAVPNKSLYMDQETNTLKYLIDNQKNALITFFRYLS